MGGIGYLCSMPREHMNCVPDAVGALLWGPLMFIASAMGVNGFAAVPHCGPALVRCLLRRNILLNRGGSTCSSIRERKSDPMLDVDSDSDSDDGDQASNSECA